MTNMWIEFDRRMLAFFKERIVAGDDTEQARENTEKEFGEDALWCVTSWEKENGTD